MSNGVVTVGGDGGGGATISAVEAAAAQAWFAHAPAGLYVLDTELRIVSAGLATQIMGGVPAERVLGRRLTDLYSLAAPSQIHAMLRKDLDTALPPPPVPVVPIIPPAAP